MKCKLVKLHKFSGNKASIYSIIIENEQETLFDKFLKENVNSFTSETKDILMRLITIGQKTGARIDFFKEFEGRPGDGVCALYDQPGSKLRLYCIKYGSQLIVVGSGGQKSKSIRTFQEDDKLVDENYFLRWLSGEITKGILNGEIGYSNNYLDFTGKLIFMDDKTED
jgi:putative component of toxin-antitoxin plasmid stabilization module